MRILIADKLAPEAAEYLNRQDGVEVTVQTGLTSDELAAVVADHDGVVVRSACKITQEVLEKAMQADSPHVRAIARAGVGVDNIHLPTATRFGIAVMNTASASTITTAEHAFALLLALARNIGQAHATMASGGWDRSKFIGAQLYGRTLGVVGFGRIGQTVARRALAFGMQVVAYDPVVDASNLDEGIRLFESFDEMIKHVDVVTFHVPKTEQTAGMLGRDQFAAAKPGLLVVNAARGGIVDEAALLEALESGQCGGAALDVFDAEPPPEDSPVRNHPRILTTPHLGASTVEAQEAVAVDACQALVTYLRGEGLIGAVNSGGLQLNLTGQQRAFVDLASRMITILHATVSPKSISSLRVSTHGETMAPRAETITRYALVELLGRQLGQIISVINAGILADEHSIAVATEVAGEQGEDRISIEIDCDGAPHKVEGAIYADGLPRITHLDGHRLDMVPAGHVVLLSNTDEPGRIGLVGQCFGEAGVNIGEMVIGRKPTGTGDDSIAMMIIKLDAEPPQTLLDSLRNSAGILRVTNVELPSA